MAYQLLLAKAFERKSKKLLKNNPTLKEKMQKVFSQLMKDPFHPALKSHKVQSKNHGIVYAAELTGELRVLWGFWNTEDIILFDVGTHKELYQ